MNKGVYHGSMPRWEVPLSWHWMSMRLQERKILKQHELFNVRYAEYIHSEAWKAKAAFMKVKQPYCFVCGIDYRSKGLHLETNHENYERLGHERSSDLFNLCPDHHPKGVYSRKQSKRDRWKYRLRKWGKAIVWLPWNVVVWCWRLLVG